MGGNLQNNPPLFPELYAALGALRFFSEDNKISEHKKYFILVKMKVMIFCGVIFQMYQLI